MEQDLNQFIWAERYRPHTIADCILPQQMQDMFQEFVKKGEIPNMMFNGLSGVGKTTVARALCEELNTDYILINGSEESGIDVLRTKIRSFASSVSFSGGKKVVILDEASNLTPAMQEGLKAFIEEFANNCRFIFTCNNKSKIIPPLHSRTTVIDFKLAKEDRMKMAGKFMKRLKTILKTEGVTFDEKLVAGVLTKYFPDYRRVLNELQRYSATGTIDASILLTSDSNLAVLIEALKEKDFRKMRSWVVNNDTDQSFFRTLYDALEHQVNEIPEMVVLLADYSYKNSFVADVGLNITALLTELMVTLTWKE